MTPSGRAFASNRGRAPSRRTSEEEEKLIYCSIEFWLGEAWWRIGGRMSLEADSIACVRVETSSASGVGLRVDVAAYCFLP